ncbi:MAG: FecR domain-containing protein [Balneolaceae bacterium]
MKKIGIIPAVYFCVMIAVNNFTAINKAVADLPGAVTHPVLLEQVQVSLQSGDTLSTDADTSAEILFLNNSRLKVPPQTEVIFTNKESGEQQSHTRIELNKGSVFLELHENEKTSVELITQNTVAMMQTGKLGAASSGFYWIEEGSVDVMAVESGQAARIHAGMFAQISEEGADILTGQLASQEIRRLNSEMEPVAVSTQELKFFYSPDDNQ